MKQLSLMEIKEPVKVDEWGTFKDSLRAPIHNWFTYPAGFSYKAVESSIHANGIKKSQVIYDPFMGSGTTNLVAKKLAINSYGVEAHPFVFRITRTKMNWDIDTDEIIHALQSLEMQVKHLKLSFNGSDIQGVLEKEFPELILKCFEYSTLLDLLFIRNSIVEGDLLNLVLLLLDDTIEREIKEIVIELHSNIGEVKEYKFSSVEKAIDFLNENELKGLFITAESFSLFDPRPTFADEVSNSQAKLFEE